MAHHDDTALEDNPASFTNVIAVICAVIAAGTLGYALFSKGPIPEVTDADFALETPAVDKQKLKKEREAAHGDVDVSVAKEEIDELLEVTRNANLMQFGSPEAKEIRDTKLLAEHHANGVITKLGIDAFMAAGQPMFDNCLSGIQAVLDDVAAGKLDANAALNDPGEAYEDYRQWCGKALPALKRFNLVTAEGKWTEPKVSPTVFDVMNRFRWAAVLDIRKPPAQQLTPYEYEVLTRWRAARGDTPAPRRVEWVQTAGRQLDGLDVNELVGNIYFQAKNYEAAYLTYRESCDANKADPFLQRKCAYLKKKASAVGMSGPVGDKGT